MRKAGAGGYIVRGTVPITFSRSLQPVRILYHEKDSRLFSVAMIKAGSFLRTKHPVKRIIGMRTRNPDKKIPFGTFMGLPLGMTENHQKIF